MYSLLSRVLYFWKKEPITTDKYQTNLFYLQARDLSFIGKSQIFRHAAKTKQTKTKQHIDLIYSDVL